LSLFIFDRFFAIAFSTAFSCFKSSSRLSAADFFSFFFSLRSGFETGSDLTGSSSDSIDFRFDGFSIRSESSSCG
jgi:hypothetical protein